MSTSTTNYGFIKPDISEPSGEEAIRTNVKLSDKILMRVDGSTQLGRYNRHTLCFTRTTSATGVTANNTVEVDDWIWYRLGASATWTDVYDVDNINGFGITYHDGWGYLEFYTPGFWRVSWNIRLQMSNATMSEGAVRAGILHYSSTDDAWNNFPQPAYQKHLKNSLVVKPMDFHLGFTDIGGDQIYKVTMQDDDSGDVKVSGGSNLYPYSGEPYYGLYLAFSHNNNSAATASTSTTETYIHVDWVRGL